nr:coatomer subunit beta'-1-like isoform X1 [Tanacetum cinerariifolium]
MCRLGERVLSDTFEGHSCYVMQMTINPKDTKLFASASLDRTIKVWDYQTKTCVQTLEAYTHNVLAVCFHSELPIILTGSEDGTLPKFVSRKQWVVAGADDMHIRLYNYNTMDKVWDYKTKTCVQTLEAHTHNVSAVCFHPELPIILTGSEDGTLRIWHATTYRGVEAEFVCYDQETSKDEVAPGAQHAKGNDQWDTLKQYMVPVAATRGYPASLIETKKNVNRYKARRSGNVFTSPLTMVIAIPMEETRAREVRRPEGRDKARAAGKKKGSKASGSSTVNEDALARLMIEQQDTRFYLQPYDHLTGDQRNAMEEIRAKIKNQNQDLHESCNPSPWLEMSLLEIA